jgi:hypothetical protein
VEQVRVVSLVGQKIVKKWNEANAKIDVEGMDRIKNVTAKSNVPFR